MSYILDALRRAESERERGQVPGVHAQPAAAGTAPKPGPARFWLASLAAALGLLLLGALAARWSATPPPTPPTAPTAPAPAAPLPTPAPRVAPPPAPELVSLPANSVPALVAAPAPRPAAQPVAQPVALSALPEALRRQLPPLATGGAMYSETPAKRMLIINGQLYQEGATVAPGLLLEQIRLNSAVLVFQGQRFRISY
ncbi:general secretion pathway protein GspB [Paucibacter soli]|uniref:general secretion pathway protein GspB n=1 Tax=Paucibacter soli TaxID=3133433 RepID=UPI00309E49A8